MHAFRGLGSSTAIIPMYFLQTSPAYRNYIFNILELTKIWKVYNVNSCFTSENWYKEVYTSVHDLNIKTEVIKFHGQDYFLRMKF